MLSVNIDSKAIRAIADEGRFPRNDRASLDRLGVAAQHAVAIDRLVGAGRTNASKLHAQGVCNGILLGQAQEVVGGILEVSHASQRHAPGLRGGDGDVEAQGLVVVGDNVLGVRIGLQRGVGQTKKACGLVGAVHVEQSRLNRECARGIGNGIARGHQSGRVNETTGSGTHAASDAGEIGVHTGVGQRHDVDVIAECGRIVCHVSVAGPDPSETAKRVSRYIYSAKYS